MIKYSKFLFVVYILFVFSCSNTDEKTYKVGFSQCISKDDWRKAMDYEMQVEASLYSELDLTIFQSNGDIEIQKSQIEFMIDNEFDVIIIIRTRASCTGNRKCFRQRNSYYYC